MSQIKNELQDLQQSIMITSNDLFQKSRFQLSSQEQKVILYLIIKSKPDDMKLKECIFEIRDFCKVCDLEMNSGANYKYIKQTLKNIRDKSFWITLEDGSETTLAWIDKVTTNKNSGAVILTIDPRMKSYLLQLKERFTSHELLYTLAMRSQYSIRLYQILKSYEYQRNKIFDLDELKHLLSAENYTRFPDFKRKVLDISMREINELSDLSITYDIIKQGRRYAKLDFSIDQKRTCPNG